MSVYKRPLVDDYQKKIEPIWKEDAKPVSEPSKISLFVATPCHSEVSLHYVQAIIQLLKLCNSKKVNIEFSIIKSSLVTQGRNLCVSAFLQSNCTHMLFIDSDIFFHANSIFKMIDCDKEIISVPYPLKSFMWDKAFDLIKKGKIKSPEQLAESMNTYPMRVPNNEDIRVNKGVIEVTHSPTGCMLIKRSVFDKLIKAYPEKKIVQNTIINSEMVPRKHMWNFFDCLHDPVEKTYLGEDFAFCKLWKDIGGTCYAYVLDEIVHIGEHQYSGKFIDELIINA
jgi:hypothetical protein